MSVSGRPRCAAGIIAGKCLERAPPLQKPQGWATRVVARRPDVVDAQEDVYYDLVPV
jgi:hypothetical protein